CKFPSAWRDYVSEADQCHPFMSKRDGHPNRYMHLKQADIYLGSVNKPSTWAPKHGTGVSNERVAVLVATAMRWFSDRRGLRACIKRLTKNNGYFTCPSTRPVFPPPLPGIHEHYSISDACRGLDMEGVPGAVARAGVYQGFEAADLFAAETLPTCDAYTAIALSDRNTLAGLSSVSACGLALYVTVANSRRHWGSQSYLLDEVSRMVSLPRLGEIPDDTATALGLLVVKSRPTSTQSIQVLSGLVSVVPASFWSPIIEHWSSCGRAAVNAGFSFVSSLPTAVHPGECAAILDIASRCTLFSPGWSLSQVLQRPALWERSGGRILLDRIHSVHELTRLKERVPLSLLVRQSVEPTSVLGPLSRLLTALNLGSSVPVFTAALERLAEASSLLRTLQTEHHEIALLGGVFAEPLKECVDSLQAALVRAPTTSVVDVPSLLARTLEQLRVVGECAGSPLFRYLMAHPQQIGIGIPPEVDDDGVETPETEGSIPDEGEEEDATLEVQPEPLLPPPPVPVVDDLVAVATCVQDANTSLLSRGVDTKTADMLARVPLYTLERHVDAICPNTRRGVADAADTKVYVRIITAMPVLRPFATALQETMKCAGNPLSDTDKASVDGIIDQIQAFQEGGMTLPRGLSTPVASHLAALCRTPESLAFYQCAAGPAKLGMAFAAAQSDSTSHLLNPRSNRGAIVPIKVVSDFTWLIADAASPMFLLKSDRPLEEKLQQLAGIDYGKSRENLVSVDQNHENLKKFILASQGSGQEGLNYDAGFILKQGFVMTLSGEGPQITVGKDKTAQKWDVHDLQLLKNQIIFSTSDDPAPKLLVLLLRTAQEICAKEASTLQSLTGHDVTRSVQFAPCEADEALAEGMLQQLKEVRGLIADEIANQSLIAQEVRRDETCAYMTTRDILSQETEMGRRIHTLHFADIERFQVNPISNPVPLKASTVSSVKVTASTVLDTVQALCRSAQRPVLSVRNVHLGSAESTIEDIKALVAHAAAFPNVCHVVALPCQMPQGVQAQMRQYLLGTEAPLPNSFGPIVLCDVTGSTATSFPALVVDRACIDSLVPLKAAEAKIRPAFLVTSAQAGQGKTTLAMQHLGPDPLHLHVSGPAKYSTLCQSIARQLPDSTAGVDLHIDVGRPLGDGKYTSGQWVAESAVFSLRWLGGLRGPGIVVPTPLRLAVEVASDIYPQAAVYSGIMGCPATELRFPTTCSQFVAEYRVTEASAQAYEAACALYILAHNKDKKVMGADQKDEEDAPCDVSALVHSLHPASGSDPTPVLKYAYEQISKGSDSLSWSAVTGVLVCLHPTLMRLGRCPHINELGDNVAEDRDALAARAEVVTRAVDFAKQYHVKAVSQSVQCQRTVIENGTRETGAVKEVQNEHQVGYANLKSTYITLDAGDGLLVFSNSGFEWPPAFKALLKQRGAKPSTTDKLTSAQRKVLMAEYCIGPDAANKCAGFQSSVAGFEYRSDAAFKMSMLHARVSQGLPVVLIGDGGTGKTALVTTYLEMRAALSAEGTFEYKASTVNAATSETDIEALFSAACAKAAEEHLADYQYVLFFDEINASPHSTEIMAGVLSGKFRGTSLPPCVSVVMAVNPLRTCHKENAMLRSMTHKVPYVFRVNPMPESMLQCMIDFGGLAAEDEKDYVLEMLKTAAAANPTLGIDDRLIQKVVATHQAAKEKSRGYSFSVSLRDINRFVSLLKVARVVFAPMVEDRRGSASEVEAFVLHLTYVLRIPDPASRRGVVSKIGGETGVGLCQAECMGWLDEAAGAGKTSDVTGMVVARNRAYSENAPALLMCIWAKVPIIIIGEPGTSKSLALRVCYEFLASAKSHEVFPTRVLETVYQGTTQSTSSGVQRVHREVLANVPKDGSSKITSMFVFDELGRAAQAPGNPLKALHSILEPHGGQENLTFAFVGLSNHSVDSAPTSRALVVYRLGTNDGLATTVRDILHKRVTTHQAEALASAHNALVAKMNTELEKGVGKSYFGLRDVFFLAHRALSEGNVGIGDPQTRAATLVARCYSIGYASENTRLCQQMVDATHSILASLNQEAECGPPKPRLTWRGWGRYAGYRRRADTDRCTAYQALKDALQDTHECARYLLVQTESPELIVDTILKEGRDLLGADRGIEVLSGSHFRGDSDVATSIQTLSALIEGARTGKLVVLLHQQRVLDCLYDMLNKNYARFSNGGVTTMRCRVSLGNCADSFVPVAPTFKLVICLSATEVAAEEPALLQRLEKVRLDIQDMGSVAEGAKALLQQPSNSKALREVVKAVPRLGSLAEVHDGLLWLHSTDGQTGEETNGHTASILELGAYLVSPTLLLTHTLRAAEMRSGHRQSRSPLLDGSMFHGCVDVLDFVQKLLRERNGGAFTLGGVPVALYRSGVGSIGGSVDNLVDAARAAGISVTPLVVSVYEKQKDFKNAVAQVPQGDVVLCHLGSMTEFIPQCQSILMKREGLSVIAVDNTTDTNSIRVGVASGVCVVDCLIKPQHLPIEFNPMPVLTLSLTDTPTAAADHADLQLKGLIEVSLQRGLHAALSTVAAGGDVKLSPERARDLSRFVSSHADKLASLSLNHVKAQLLARYGSRGILSSTTLGLYTSVVQATDEVLMAATCEALVPVLRLLACRGLLDGYLDEDPASDAAQGYAAAVLAQIGGLTVREYHGEIVRHPQDMADVTAEQIRAAHFQEAETRHTLAPLVECDMSTTPTLLIHAVRTTLLGSLNLPENIASLTDAVQYTVSVAVEALAESYQEEVSRDALLVLCKVALSQLSLAALRVSSHGLSGAVSAASHALEGMSQDADAFGCLSQMLVSGITYMGCEYSRFDHTTPSGAMALSTSPAELNDAVVRSLPDATLSQRLAFMPIGEVGDESYMSVCATTSPESSDTAACHVFTARLCGEVGVRSLLSDIRVVDAGLSVMITHHAEQVISTDTTVLLGAGTTHNDILSRVAGVLLGNTLTVGWSVAAAVFRVIAKQASSDTGSDLPAAALATLFNSSRLCQMAFVWHCRQGRENDTEWVETRVTAVLGEVVASTIFVGSYVERYPLTGLVDWALHSRPAFGIGSTGVDNPVALFRRQLVTATSSGDTNTGPDDLTALHDDIGLEGIALIGELAGWDTTAPGSLVHAVSSNPSNHLLPFEWLKAEYAFFATAYKEVSGSSIYLWRCPCGGILFVGDCGRNSHNVAGGFGFRKCDRCNVNQAEATCTRVAHGTAPSATRVANSVFYTGVERGFVANKDTVPPCDGSFAFTSHMRSHVQETIFVRCVLAALHLKERLRSGTLGALSEEEREVLVGRVNMGVARIGDKLLPLVRRTADTILGLPATTDVCARFAQETRLCQTLRLSDAAAPVHPPAADTDAPAFPLTAAHAVSAGLDTKYVSLLQPQTPAQIVLGEASAAHRGGRYMETQEQAAAWCEALRVLPQVLSLPRVVFQPLRYTALTASQAVLDQPLQSVLHSVGADVPAAKTAVDAWNTVSLAFFTEHFPFVDDCHSVELRDIDWDDISFGEFMAFCSDCAIPAQDPTTDQPTRTTVSSVLREMVRVHNAIAQAIVQELGIQGVTLETVGVSGFSIRNTPSVLDVYSLDGVPALSREASVLLSGTRVLSALPSLVLIDDAEAALEIKRSGGTGSLQWVQNYEGYDDIPRHVPFLRCEESIDAMPVESIGRAVAACSAVQDAVSTLASPEDGSTSLRAFLERWGVSQHVTVLSEHNLLGVEVRQVLRLTYALQVRLGWESISTRIMEGVRARRQWSLSASQAATVGALTRDERERLEGMVKVVSHRMDRKEIHKGMPGPSDTYCTTYEQTEAGEAVCGVLDSVSVIALVMHFTGIEGVY
ncbi:hypothetical protein KIPB_000512, partial [Kipferlia bialata]